MNTLAKVFLFGIIFSAIGCSSPTEQEIAPQVENSDLISMADKGLELGFSHPESEKQGTQPIVTFNDQLGTYEVNLGEGLSFFISEEATSIDEIKEELRGDLLFTYKFYDEGTDALLYQAVLPDGTEYLYQYVRTIDVNNTKYLLSSDKDAEFSLQQIKLIKKVMNSVSSLD